MKKKNINTKKKQLKILFYSYEYVFAEAPFSSTPFSAPGQPQVYVNELIFIKFSCLYTAAF